MDDKKIEGVIRKIEALLNTKGCTEAEAEARMAKAQELLEAYNLDMAEIGTSKGAQRKDTTKKGGLYAWQRKLWQAVAELNFCYYVSIKGLERGSTYQHRVIGSHANVVGTEVMAKYLQDTIERTAQQWAKDNYYKSVFVREAIAYREGMATRLSERLQERRRNIVAEEERKRDEARAKADPGTTALTILDVISTEADLNNDYLNDWEPGTTARHRAESERRQAKWLADWKAREAAKTPEQKEAERLERERRNKEWLEQERKRQARADKRPYKPRYRKPTPEEERAQMGSYWEGQRKANEINLDQQVDEDKKRRIG